MEQKNSEENCVANIHGYCYGIHLNPFSNNKILCKDVTSKFLCHCYREDFLKIAQYAIRPETIQ